MQGYGLFKALQTGRPRPGSGKAPRHLFCDDVTISFVLERKIELFSLIEKRTQTVVTFTRVFEAYTNDNVVRIS